MKRISKVVSPSVRVLYSTLSPSIFFTALVLSGAIGTLPTSTLSSIYLFSISSMVQSANSRTQRFKIRAKNILRESRLFATAS